MSKTSNGELKPIGWVVDQLSQEFPDITHSSLRFLEREKLVEPERTAGGHRMYSNRHIERIRRIKEWQKERLSLDEIRDKLAAADQLDPPDELAERFLNLAVAGDLPAAQRVILDADELGMPLIAIFEEIIKPALYDLGDRWEEGQLSVGQEKEISALARDLIAELSLRHAVPPGYPYVIVAACIPGEYHELGLRMVSGVLQSRGYVVHYLGPSVDPEFLIERIKRRNPHVVLLTATRDELLPHLERTVTAIRQELAADEVPEIVIGGQIVQNNRAALEGLGIEIAADASIQTTVDSVFACLNH